MKKLFDKVNLENLNFFRFKEWGKEYLLTNEIGNYIFLSKDDFKRLVEGRISETEKLYENLAEKGFLRNDLDLTKSVIQYQKQCSSILGGPSLHIIVVTLRCNQNCLYCQTSSRPMSEKNCDMSIATARRAVDLIFQSPSQVINIEFQGGEPLANWPVVKFVVEYAQERNKRTGRKTLLMGLVTNLTLMDKKKLDFLIKKRVSICTSLDGPAEVHNFNRPFPSGNSYSLTIRWIKEAKRIEKESQKKGRDMYHIAALATISRRSLSFPKEIVDEYLRWGFEGIHLRPLSYLGSAGELKDKIGYSTKEFLVFWGKALDYIIDLNIKGKKFYERGSRIMLQKILNHDDPGFTELRSPCGAVTGQLLYNYDGRIFSCDEGRMCGDDTFQIGDLKGKEAKRGNSKKYYGKIINSPKTKTILTASTLDNSQCDLCVYKPYCGICPVMNYTLYGNLFPAGPCNDWCKLHQGMFDYIFKKMRQPKVMKVFKSWASLKKE
jgi:His-Xaa-Ser system radical SAM maturase HxsB